MNKRGQFFLISALVIVGIIIGLTTIYNQIQTNEEDTTIYDLSREISYESGQVIDNGIIYSLSQPEIESHLINLTDFYSQTNPESEFNILYGDGKTLKILQYKKANTGSISVSVGGSEVTINGEGSEKKQGSKDRCNEKGVSCADKVEVNLDNTNYNFDLREGQFFYVIIKKNKPNNEAFVAGPQLSPPSDKKNTLYIDAN